MIKIERISHFAAPIVTDLNRYTCLLRGVQWRVPEMRRMVELSSTAHRPDLGEQSVNRLGHSTLLLNNKVPEQMTAECLCLPPRWNRLASSTSCFGSSACLQSSSSVLCKTAYGLESPQDRLDGTHAEGTGHPDKLTVHGWRWYYARGTHC